MGHHRDMDVLFSPRGVAVLASRHVLTCGNSLNALPIAALAGEARRIDSEEDDGDLRAEAYLGGVSTLKGPSKTRT
jgi:hypothetical protein